MTVNTDFSITSLTMGAYTGVLDFSANNNSPTMQTFNCSGTGVRTLNMGSGTWTVSGTGTLWDTSTSTNLTLSAGASTISLTNSSATSRTMTGNSVAVNNLNITAGTGSVFFVNMTVNNLVYTGFTGDSSSTITILGNLTLGAGMTSSGSGVTNLNPTSGTKLLTFNGVVYNRPITINASVGAGIQLQDTMDLSGATARTLTLTQGNFDANNKAVTVGLFASSNSNTRVLTMGSGTWTLTGNNATIWTTATVTGLSITGSGSINCNYSGATGTRVFTNGFVNLPDNVNITAGTDLFSLNTVASGTYLGNIDFTGFAGTLVGGASTSATFSGGNVILSTGMTMQDSDATHSWGFTGSGTQTFTTNGVTIYHSVTKSGAGTLTLGSKLTLGVDQTSGISINGGGFNANNFNVTTFLFSSSNATTRTLTMGSGTWTLTGTGTVWTTATTTGLTLNQGTSTIVINDASASSKTIASGVTTLNNLTLSGAGTGTFIIGTTTGTSTFNNISVLTPPHTVQIFAGKTVVASSLTWSGTLGNLNTFQSTTNGTAWTIFVGSGVVAEEYISLQDSTADGAVPFYAGSNSTNVSGNTNWLFSDSIASDTDEAKRDDNRVPTLITGSSQDGSTVILVFANPQNHGLLITDGTSGSDLGPTNAPRDPNFVPALLLTSTDGVTPVVAYSDNLTHKLYVKST